jgi:F-type H+-transporting ATPase subunit gamma
MTTNVDDLRQKLRRTEELRSVITTMKLLAAIAAGRLETALTAAQTADEQIELGLATLIRNETPRFEGEPLGVNQTVTGRTTLVAFGSSQGLVGSFNRRVAQSTQALLTELTEPPMLMAWGERMGEAMRELHMEPNLVLSSLGTPEAISDSVREILQQTIAQEDNGPTAAPHHLLLVFNLSSEGGSYQTSSKRILPLDDRWLSRIMTRQWPSRTRPELVGPTKELLHTLIEHHIFLSLHETLLQSRLAENRARLLAMSRAEKRIDERRDELTHAYHSARQESIDAELFDLISGFESLAGDHFGRVLRSASIAASAGNATAS